MRAPSISPTITKTMNTNCRDASSDDGRMSRPLCLSEINRAKRKIFNAEKIRTIFFFLRLAGAPPSFRFNYGVKGVYAKFHGRLVRRVRFSPLSFFTPHASTKPPPHALT